MYFLDALKVLRRRWIVVMVGLLCMGGGAAAVLRYVPTEYTASGQLILLLPPTVNEDLPPVNPYLNLPPELTTTASLLAGNVMTRDAHRTIAEEGFEAEYDVAVVPGAGPVLIITTKDTDADQTLATRDAVMERLQADLAQIQTVAEVPRRQVITATESSVEEVPEPLPGSKIRALAGLVGVGGTLTLLAAFLLDRRRARSSSGSAIKGRTGGETLD